MIKEITSRNNSLIVDLIKLKQKKYRKERGLALIEGERFVAEMAQRGVEFEYLLFKEKPSINLNCAMIKCNDEVLSALAQTVWTCHAYRVACGTD